MRAYAVLLGTLLTVGSAYVAQVAANSAGSGRAVHQLPERADRAAAAPLWHGGTLDPITIPARRSPIPARTVTGLDRVTDSLPYGHPGGLRYHTTSVEKIHTSIDPLGEMRHE